MFYKLFALLALVAVALAAPNPKPGPAPAPAPQVLAYSTGLDYLYPAGAVPSVISPYAAPLAYSAALPAGAVYLR